VHEDKDEDEEGGKILLPESIGGTGVNNQA
jgi:hypothetical protein